MFLVHPTLSEADMAHAARVVEDVFAEAGTERALMLHG